MALWELTWFVGLWVGVTALGGASGVGSHLKAIAERTPFETRPLQPQGA